MSRDDTEARIGARIRALRLERGMTIATLAKKAGGMSPVYLGNIERGRDKNPSAKLLGHLARALSVDMATLLDLYEGRPVTELRKLARGRIDGLTADELCRLLRVTDAIR